jgi:hypothetical protein
MPLIQPLPTEFYIGRLFIARVEHASLYAYVPCVNYLVVCLGASGASVYWVTWISDRMIRISFIKQHRDPAPTRLPVRRNRNKVNKWTILQVIQASSMCWNA